MQTTGDRSRLDDAHLTNAAYDIHADDSAFGYRVMTDELCPRDITAGENRVACLRSQQRDWLVFAKKRGLTRKACWPVLTMATYADLSGLGLKVQLQP